MSSFDDIARRLLDKSDSRRRRVIVAVGGIPGGGKSTLAYPLTSAVNALHRRRGGNGDVAVCIGVDGWHYSQTAMRSMPDSARLFARRGAHFTFDGEAFTSFIRQLDTRSSVSFPTFSHADKDPVPHGGEVVANQRIIIVEGLHALLDLSPWNDVAARYDERIFVETPPQLARSRIIVRHLRDGVERTTAAATRRADESDMLNAHTLLANLVPPSIVVDCEAGSIKYMTKNAGLAINLSRSSSVDTTCSSSATSPSSVPASPVPAQTAAAAAAASPPGHHGWRRRESMPITA